MTRSSRRRLEQDFASATPRQQRAFLVRLPRLLHLSQEDLALLRASEPTFAFWDNADDDASDAL
jgi:hypothetical protein